MLKSWQFRIKSWNVLTCWIRLIIHLSFEIFLLGLQQHCWNETYFKLAYLKLSPMDWTSKDIWGVKISKRPKWMKEMDIVMIFIAGEGFDIIMHLVKPLKQCCLDLITYLNEFHVLLFFISQIKLADTDMPSSLFMKVRGIHTFSCKAFVPHCSF